MLVSLSGLLVEEMALQIQKIPPPAQLILIPQLNKME